MVIELKALTYLCSNQANFYLKTCVTIANINFYIVLKEIFKEKGWRYLNCRKTLSQLTKNQRMKLAKELEKINHDILKAESKKWV